MSSTSNLAIAVVQATASEWITVMSLVFGGCCSNALATEWLNGENPYAGKLVTFAQFLLVSLFGFAKQLRVEDSQQQPDPVARAVGSIAAARNRGQPMTVSVHGTSTEHVTKFKHELEQRLRDANGAAAVLTSGDKVGEASIHLGGATPSVSAKSHLLLDQSGQHVVEASGLFASQTPRRPLWWRLLHIRLKPRKIPIRVWIIQVTLFLITSLLNNIAFAYKVPMAVHIIFRSAGSLTNMLCGYLTGRRYTRDQILSILLVSAGVAASTYSAVPRGPRISTTSTTDTSTYLSGIAILALALVISSFMGLEQDRVYKRYGRGHWEEALFYLHVLAMPMFALMWGDISAQIHTANASPPFRIGIDSLAGLAAQRIGGPFAIVKVPWWARAAVTVPSLWVPLALNLGTQLLCVMGVNRLTTRVSSLTVTLILVLRKAISLWISVVLLGKGDSNAWLWCGAAMVLLGTIWYALDSRRSAQKVKKD